MRVSDSAAASSFSTPLQPVSKKLVKFNSTPNSAAMSKSQLLSTQYDIDRNTEKVSSNSSPSSSNQNIVLSSTYKKHKQQVDKDVGQFFKDNAGNSGILFFLLYL